MLPIGCWGVGRTVPVDAFPGPPTQRFWQSVVDGRPPKELHLAATAHTQGGAPGYRHGRRAPALVKMTSTVEGGMLLGSSAEK